jgi:sulfoacetaldehyde acetyltransferase
MSVVTGSEAFVEVLRKEGVTDIFGIVGSAFMDPLDLFPQAGIRFISVRHEQNAALMAAGYGLASGRPGVCIGQNGPGVTNLVTGIASAYLNHVPVVLITPSVTSAGLGKTAMQEVEQMSLFSKITVYQTQVNRPDKIAWAMRNAFRAATMLQGPAQVDIARDYWYGQFEYADLEPSQYRPSTRRGGAPPSEIRRAAEIISRAKDPFILVGWGVIESNCAADVARLAERLGAPVGTVYLHNDAFPIKHPLAVGPIGYQGSKAAMRLISQADVVLALGTRLNTFGTIPQYDLDYFPKNAAIVQNDINPMNLGMNWPLAAGLLGDAGEVTRQLIVEIDKSARKPSQQRLDQIALEKMQWEKELRDLSSSDAMPIVPRRALWEISRAITPDTIVTLDVGNITGQANSYFNFNEPRKFLGPGNLGGIGVGYSTALGAKRAMPDTPVLSISGDGAWSMTLQEVMTAVHEKLGVVALVMDNGVWGAERRNQYDFFGERYFFTDLENPDFAEVARAMGAHAVSIRDPKQIGPAIKEAFAKGGPAVLDIHVDPKILCEPYRRDALLTPTRLMERYREPAHHMAIA